MNRSSVGSRAGLAWRLVDTYLRLLRIALMRRAGSYRVPKDLQYLVVSPGGVGSTAFLRHLSSFGTCNAWNDADGLKHRPRPPRWIPPECRVVFIDGEADDIVASLMARGFHTAQAAKLGAVGYFFVPRQTWRLVLLKRAIFKQSLSWCAETKQILVVDYDTMWNSAEQLGEFLGLSGTDFLLTFPAQRPRTSRSSRGLSP